MYNSVLQFFENGIPKLEKEEVSFYESRDISALVTGVRQNVTKLECDLIGECFDRLDDMIRDDGKRKRLWEIVRLDEKTMLTSAGLIKFHKTLYKNKKTGERAYLLDKFLDIEKGARMTEDAEAKMFCEASGTSYQRAGEEISEAEGVSKSTVKNKLHELVFPSQEPPKEKKTVQYLYIDADEDHVPLQFYEKKGDIKDSGNRYNNAIVKLAYVYEGLEPESPNSKRWKLKEAHYFSGIYEGDDNRKLWDEIYEYIDGKYDLDSVEKIYLNSDGGSWIKWHKQIFGIVNVLDEYHINKYITQMTTHLYDSKDDGAELLRESIRRDSKESFIEKVAMIKRYAEDDRTRERIEQGLKYIADNWSAAKLRLRRREGVVGSSTEGHVSHVLASRMSSRPLGWSKIGADKMGKLRAYIWNKGDILELVRYQKEKKETEKVSGEEAITLTDIEAYIRKSRGDNGKYFEALQHKVSYQAAKILAIREGIDNI